MDHASYTTFKDNNTNNSVCGIIDGKLYCVYKALNGYYEQKEIYPGLPMYFNMNKSSETEYISKCAVFYEEFKNKFHKLSSDKIDQFYTGLVTKIPSNIFFNFDSITAKFKELKIIKLIILKKELEGDCCTAGPGAVNPVCNKYKYNHIKIFLVDCEQNKYLLFNSYDKTAPVYGNFFGICNLVIYPEDIKIVEIASHREKILSANNLIIVDAVDKYFELFKYCENTIYEQKKNKTKLTKIVFNYLKNNIVDNQKYYEMFIHISELTVKYFNDIDMIIENKFTRKDLISNSANLVFCSKRLLSEFYRKYDKITNTTVIKKVDKIFDSKKILSLLIEYDKFKNLGNIKLTAVINDIEVIFACEFSKLPEGFESKLKKNKKNELIQSKLKEYGLDVEIKSKLHDIPKIYTF